MHAFVKGYKASLVGAIYIKLIQFLKAFVLIIISSICSLKCLFLLSVANIKLFIIN